MVREFNGVGEYLVYRGEGRVFILGRFDGVPSEVERESVTIRTGLLVIESCVELTIVRFKFHCFLLIN